MPELESLQQRIAAGKLPLKVRVFIELMLMNSTAIQATRLDVYTSADRITTAKAPFDPLLDTSFTASRSISPAFFGGGGFSGTGTGQTGTGSTGSGNGSSIIFLPQT